MLGIGEGLFPPAKFAVEQDADYCLQQAKALIGSITKDVATCRRWLASARERCQHGEWGALLKKHGISRTTAWRVLTDDDEPEICSTETFDDVDQGENKDLGNGAPVAYEPPPAPSPPPGKEKRQPGQDALEPLDRAKKIIDKEINEANLQRQISAATIIGVQGAVRNALAAVQELWNAPKKKAKPPIEKVCQCGTNIILAQTRTGKMAAFEFSQAAHGKFNLVDGLMVYSKNGGDYFLHRIRCPARKKT
jgi:hypothetical protein